MEHERLVNERQSIRESARQLKKYGSTCNHVRNNEQLIRITLEKTDTLPGIALKYGCTTEQIRRANRLFAQDSLFMREYLMVPVERDSVHCKNTDRIQSLPPRAATIDVVSRSTSNSIYDDMLSPEEESRKSMDEFLGKIDSTIAKTRKFVAKSQNSMAENSTDHLSYFDENASSSSSHSHHTNYYHKQSSATRPNENGPTAQIMVMTQGRRVQSSLHRLEQQQDEFYQL